MNLEYKIGIGSRKMPKMTEKFLGEAKKIVAAANDDHFTTTQLIEIFVQKASEASKLYSL